LLAGNHLLVERSHLAIGTDVLRFILKHTYLLAYLHGSGCGVARHYLHLDTSLATFLHGSRDIRTDWVVDGSNSLK